MSRLQFFLSLGIWCSAGYAVVQLVETAVKVGSIPDGVIGIFIYLILPVTQVVSFLRKSVPAISLGVKAAVALG
jgi:hypothetical protein